MLAKEVPDWIRFVNTTISEGIKFEMNPPVEEASVEYNIYFILTDYRMSKDDESQIFEFTVRVKEPLVFETEKEPVLVTIQPPDYEGKFDVKFDKFIRLPSNFTDWNNDNEGAERIKIDYEPTEETLTFMYD